MTPVVTAGGHYVYPLVVAEKVYVPIFKVPGDAFKKDAKEDLRLQLDAAENEGCAFVVPAEHVAMLKGLLAGGDRALKIAEDRIVDLEEELGAALDEIESAEKQ